MSENQNKFIFRDTRKASISGYLYYPLSEVNEHLGYFLLSQRLRGCLASILVIREGARIAIILPLFLKLHQDEKEYYYIVVKCELYRVLILRPWAHFSTSVPQFLLLKYIIGLFEVKLFSIQSMKNNARQKVSMQNIIAVMISLVIFLASSQQLALT